MCERNGSYGMPHFTLMRLIFIKQRIKLAVSLLNWKRTNYLFGVQAAVVVGWEPSPRHRPSPCTPAWASPVSGPRLPKLGSNLAAMGAQVGTRAQRGARAAAADAQESFHCAWAPGLTARPASTAPAQHAKSIGVELLGSKLRGTKSDPINVSKSSLN